MVAINRSAAVVKGGRRFSFSALSVVGNRNGLVGIGYGKGREVPNAIEKSVKDARKQIMRVVRQGTTIPHATEGHFCATKVRLLPAAIPEFPVFNASFDPKTIPPCGHDKPGGKPTDPGKPGKPDRPTTGAR